MEVKYFTESVAALTQFGYNGKGMQATSQIAVEISSDDERYDVADARVLETCAMMATAYDTFAVNPAVASGIRTSATDTEKNKR